MKHDKFIVKLSGISILYQFFYILSWQIILLTVINYSVYSVDLSKLKLPKGFQIQIYSDNIPSARAMAYSPKGILYVGSKIGNVYALTDLDKDHTVDKIYIIAKNLTMPVGVDYFQKSLYISAIHRILSIKNIDEKLSNPGKPVIIYDKFPRDKHHGWKFIRFGPDGLLYIPVGAPCNICLKKDRRYSSIMRMKADGGNLELFAEGIRNSVGFDWHPNTGDLWFTENGRDWMGDNQPPDEVNFADKPGNHYGFPYVHGKSISDPKYGSIKTNIQFTDPVYELPAHVAALGMRFYTGKMFPKEYHDRIFIAEHGSWNRSEPIGYRISSLRIKNNKAVDYKIFVSGWLAGKESWGRPADVLILPDGSLLISDDKAGIIYRITYIK